MKQSVSGGFFTETRKQENTKKKETFRALSAAGVCFRD
jgi:hypothetical protein